MIWVMGHSSGGHWVMGHWCGALQLTSWSDWPLCMDDDAQFTGVYGVQSTPFTHGQSDPDDIISAFYARMLIAETSRTTQPQTRDDYWSVDGGLSPRCGTLGVGGVMTASGSSSAETGSFVFGPGGSGVLADLYDDYVDDDDNRGVDDNDNYLNAFSGFFDGSFSTDQLRSGLGAAAGDDAGTSAGPWRLRPDVGGVSAVVGGGGGSCGSDGATSPSCSPAESSTGSAA